MPSVFLIKTSTTNPSMVRRKVVLMLEKGMNMPILQEAATLFRLTYLLGECHNRAISSKENAKLGLTGKLGPNVIEGFPGYNPNTPCGKEGCTEHHFRTIAIGPEHMPGLRALKNVGDVNPKLLVIDEGDGHPAWYFGGNWYFTAAALEDIESYAHDTTNSPSPMFLLVALLRLTPSGSVEALTPPEVDELTIEAAQYLGLPRS